jgi:hypothetical protein
MRSSPFAPRHDRCGRRPTSRRVIGLIQRECLDHVIAVNAAGLQRVLSGYTRTTWSRARIWHSTKTHRSRAPSCRSTSARPRASAAAVAMTVPSITNVNAPGDTLRSENSTSSSTLSAHDVDRAQRWFQRDGAAAVFFGGLTPGVRTFASLPAGFSSMPLAPFLLYSALGPVLWTAALAYAGMVLQANFTVVGDYIDHATNVLWQCADHLVRR